MALLSNSTGKLTESRPLADVDDGDAVVGTARVDERLAARKRLEARTATAAMATNATTVLARSNSEALAQLGPRPRASLLATLSLMLGVGAALTALTGVLAGPGVGLGLIAAVLGSAGVAATSRRHVAGKSDALLGIALGLGAVVIGTLALTGTLPWLSGDTDQVMRVRDWLDTRLPWLFPSS